MESHYSMSQIALQAEDILQGKIRFKIDFIFPELIKFDVDLWANVLLEIEQWPTVKIHKQIDAAPDSSIKITSSFLYLSRLLIELSGVPLFEVPKIISISKDEIITNKFVIEVEAIQIENIAREVYQIALSGASKLCNWMIKNYPTDANKIKAFDFIVNQVINPVKNLVPRGKSTIPILNVAYNMGIPYKHLGKGVYQLGWGSKSRKMNRSVSDLDPAIGLMLTTDKAITAKILRDAGLPTTEQFFISSEADALEASSKTGFPVVIKPNDGDRGEGVTVDIYSVNNLLPALIRAKKYSRTKTVILEKQALGICHRLFVANGSLLYAVKRHPMSIIGDGERTIEMIMEAAVNENLVKPPWQRSEIKGIDEIALQNFRIMGYTPNTVVGKDVVVPLRRIESTEWGGIDEEVTTIVHQENLQIALLAAKILNLNISGIDIITTDISIPWYESGAVINEVNFAPLFGGGKISKSYIPIFLSQFINEDGKIPIKFFDSFQEASDYQRKLVKHGQRCFLVTPQNTYNNFGANIKFPFVSTVKRIRALVMRPDVDSISVTLRH